LIQYKLIEVFFIFHNFFPSFTIRPLPQLQDIRSVLCH